MISKMEANDLVALEKLSENGLSSSEVMVVKRVMARNFDEEEQNRIKELLAEK